MWFAVRLKVAPARSGPGPIPVSRMEAALRLPEGAEGASMRDIRNWMGQVSLQAISQRFPGVGQVAPLATYEHWNLPDLPPSGVPDFLVVVLARRVQAAPIEALGIS